MIVIALFLDVKVTSCMIVDNNHKHVSQFYQSETQIYEEKGYSLVKDNESNGSISNI